MKLNQTLSKTIEATSAAALDTAYAAFVRGLGEEKLIETRFAYISGGYVLVIIYSNG